MRRVIAPGVFLVTVNLVFDRLEKRFGFLAIPHIVRALVLFQAMAYLFGVLNPATATSAGFLALLELVPQKVLQGEVWRVVTFLFVPRNTSQIFIIFALLILWMLGEGIEQAIGRFKLTLYVLLSVICQVAAAFTLGWSASGELLFWALLLAFATIYPEQVLYVMLIIPIKVKWLGYIVAVILLIQLIALPPLGKIGLVLSMSNYLLFFGIPYLTGLKASSAAKARRLKFEREAAALTGADGAFHRCCVCGATEKTHPDRYFRVASDGKEYCNLHLPKGDSA